MITGEKEQEKALTWYTTIPQEFSRLAKHWTLQQRTTSIPEAQQHLPSHLYSAHSQYHSLQLTLVLSLNCKSPVVLPEELHYASAKEYVQRHLHKGLTFQCVTVCLTHHFWGESPSLTTQEQKLKLHIALSQFQLPFTTNYDIKHSQCIHVKSNITAD